MEGHIHHPSLTCSLLVLLFLFLFVVECSDAIASPWVSRQHEGLPSSVKEQTLALSLSSHGLHEASHGGNVSFARLLPVLFQQYLYVLLLKDTTQEVSSVTTAFNDTVAITELLASSKQLLSALYCNISTSILNVGNNNVEESILSYHQTNKLDITLGIVPSTLQNAGDIMIVDPINTTTSTRRVDPYVVYLFATMEEQFYVAASSIADSSSSSSALPRVNCVVRQHDGQNDAEILFALRQSFATFQVPIETTVISATGNLTDSMSPTQMNVLVGLTSDDVPDLVAFLDANPGATALVNFDELTLLYDAFSTAYEGVYRPSMDRLLYATNLPRWSFAPTNPRATVLSLFFDVSSVNLRTPAALRTYISAVFMDGIAYRVSRTYSRDNLPRGLYKSSVFTVDYHLSFGPYTKYCPYPSINQLSCLVNYGARDVSLWPLSSAFKSKVGSVYGPVSAQLRMMRADGTTVAKDPHLSAVLIFVFCVMAAMAVCTTLVGYGCARGFFDVEDEVVTILHASLQQFHKSHENQNIDAALEAYSSAVDNLVTHHACMEVESNEGGFVVVSRSASTAVTLALELQLELVRICALRHCVGAVALQIGIHTASCPVTHALDDGDRSAAWPAVASAALLAACVSKLASGSAVLATRWTLQTLVQTMGVRVRACSLGSYQLNEEDSVIEVYSIHSCSRWFHRELSWRGSEGILSSNPLSSVSGEM